MKLQKFEITWTMRGWINKHPVYAENYRDAVYDGRKLETQVPWDGNYGEWKCVISGAIIELRRIRRPKWLKISPTRTGAGFSHLRSYRAEQWDPIKRTAVARDDNGVSQVVKVDSAGQIGGHPFRVVGRDWQERRAKEWAEVQLTAIQYARAANQRFISSLFKRAF